MDLPVIRMGEIMGKVILEIKNYKLGFRPTTSYATRYPSQDVEQVIRCMIQEFRQEI